MNTVQWSDTLRLDYEPMDRMHRELVDLLALAQHAPDAALAQAWAAVVEHTTRLFDQEDHWMRSTQLASAGNHVLQHRVVLNVLREGLVMARRGEHAPVREMADELAAWFVKHTQSLDAALALHMRGHPEVARQAPYRTRRNQPDAARHHRPG